jgi:chromosome partitioning protein
MRTILVVNSKGGCGKSTIATNLAAYYAREGRSVALADFDPQGSSLQWLEARSAERPPIEGMAGLESGFRLPRHIDYVILDAPAGIRGAELTALVRRAQTILIPVLPSATDMRATARFVRDLLLVGKVSRKETRLATIANRVPETPAMARAAEILLNGVDFSYQSVPSQIYRPLERFLTRLKIPLVATLPESPSYALADARGLGICELGESRSAWDFVRWRPLLNWLDSPHSLPRSV